MYGQPATCRLLLTELAAFVANAVKDYPFPDPSGGLLDCRVFIHGLPEDQEDKVYPFVAVRWAEGEIKSAEDSKTELQDMVALILGVYAPQTQEQAGLLCAELMDVLRRALWKQRIIANRFELVEPLRASIPDVQQRLHTYHMATIETVWNYTWPPKALEDAGLSQLLQGGGLTGSYSCELLERHEIPWGEK